MTTTAVYVCTLVDSKSSLPAPSAANACLHLQWVGSLVQVGQQPKIGVSCGTSSEGASGVSVQVRRGGSGCRGALCLAAWPKKAPRACV